MTELLTCKNCTCSFTSRSKLFIHLRSCPAISNTIPTLESAESNHKNQAIESFSTNGINSESEIIQESIRIVQEDENWYRVIVKPQGMATMGISGREHETLLNSPAMLILPERIKYKKASPCHRLDRATGGLVLCSKSKEAERSLTTCFRLHEVTKRYRAIVRGQLYPLNGIINSPINGMLSETKYQVVCCTPSYQYGFVTTVDLWPLTGRRHQLRKHLMGIGHAILGDQRYSSALDWPAAPYTQTLFLWALEISFPHKGHSTVDTQTLKLPISSSSVISADIAQSHPPEGDSSRITSSELEPVYPIIKVEISEPIYYEEFRQLHAVNANGPIV